MLDSNIATSAVLLGSRFRRDFAILELVETRLCGACLRSSPSLLLTFIRQVLESLLIAYVHSEIDQRRGQCQRSAVTSLLSMVCDAVVETDAELNIKAYFTFPPRE